MLFLGTKEWDEFFRKNRIECIKILKKDLVITYKEYCARFSGEKMKWLRTKLEYRKFINMIDRETKSLEGKI